MKILKLVTIVILWLLALLFAVTLVLLCIDIPSLNNPSSVVFPLITFAILMVGTIFIAIGLKSANKRKMLYGGIVVVFTLVLIFVYLSSMGMSEQTAKQNADNVETVEITDEMEQLISIMASEMNMNDYKIVGIDNYMESSGVENVDILVEAEDKQFLFALICVDEFWYGMSAKSFELDDFKYYWLTESMRETADIYDWKTDEEISSKKKTLEELSEQNDKIAEKAEEAFSVTMSEFYIDAMIELFPSLGHFEYDPVLVAQIIDYEFGYLNAMLISLALKEGGIESLYGIDLNDIVSTNDNGEIIVGEWMINSGADSAITKIE